MLNQVDSGINSEPALICVSKILFSALPEQSEIPLVEKLERQEIFQSLMFDEEL